MNTLKYGHGETRNKELIKKRYYAKMTVLQSLISPWKKEGEKRKKNKLLQHGVFEFGHPSKY